MSLFSVAKNLTGLIPGTPLSLAQNAVVNALGSIYDSTDWSFQKQQAGWLAPGILFNTGTFSTTPYTNTVIADATATAALAAHTGRPFITELQFRNPSYSVYNIVGYDTTTNAPYATLTLDRPWMEPITGPQPYIIYQAYFVSPCADFRKFVGIQDTTNDQDIDFWSMTQAELARIDPERTDFSTPRYAVPAGIDQRPGSSTAGYQMFELWPHQGSYVPYTLTYRRRGPVPQSAADYLSMTAPYPLTETMVEWRAREWLCQYKEAQKDGNAQRGAGANWMLLAQMAQKEYATLLGQALAIDLNLDGEALSMSDRHRRRRGASYATMRGGLNLGGYPQN